MSTKVVKISWQNETLDVKRRVYQIRKDLACMYRLRLFATFPCTTLTSPCLNMTLFRTRLDENLVCLYLLSMKKFDLWVHETKCQRRKENFWNFHFLRSWNEIIEIDSWIINECVQCNAFHSLSWYIPNVLIKTALINTFTRHFFAQRYRRRREGDHGMKSQF